MVSRKSRARLIDGDPVAAFHGARAFRSSVVQYVERFTYPLDEHPQGFSSEEIGQLAFMAANLIFAVELYLKTLLLLEEKETTAGHDLPQLFAELSVEAKAKIQQALEHEIEALPRGVACTIELRGDRTPNTAADASDPPKRAAASPLDIILNDTGSSFTSWRYFYEIPRDRAFITHRIRHVGLSTLCRILDRHARRRLMSGGLAMDRGDGGLVKIAPEAYTFGPKG
jgi:hypothetical protein